MNDEQRVIRGRGAVSNPANRFETISRVDWDDVAPEDRPRPQTRFFHDLSRSIVSHNDSPDIPFNVSVNPYRGCEHGCAYCYARPTHEYLGLSAGLDFETQIMVKLDAARLLRQTMLKPGWQPQLLALSGVTDPYQPVERKLRITRACLEVLAEFRNPVGIITKNHLVTRDSDLLADLATHQAVSVFVSLTSLDHALVARLEPRTASPQRRLDAIARLAAAGVPVGVLVAPIIPAVNDREIPAILAAAAAAGATFANRVMLRLPLGVAPMFAAWLEEHFPDRKQRVLGLIREMRDGRLNNARFGQRMRATGPVAGQINALFELHRRRCGLAERGPKLSTRHFRRPADAQMNLFE